MSINVNLAGVNKTVAGLRTNVGGQTKEVSRVLLNVGGVSKEVYSSGVASFVVNSSSLNVSGTYGVDRYYGYRMAGPFGTYGELVSSSGGTIYLTAVERWESWANSNYLRVELHAPSITDEAGMNNLKNSLKSIDVDVDVDVDVDGVFIPLQDVINTNYTYTQGRTLIYSRLLPASPAEDALAESLKNNQGSSFQVTIK
ncbi:MAG: hypothetical protein B0D91_10600 [Oceanospirillales bacterium LUC14_002_19_P2]|nr:MAG: hypothetical protein B0D91_10600 [Oceanospirillales bacterium LUC14_002_19_P2]